MSSNSDYQTLTPIAEGRVGKAQAEILEFLQNAIGSRRDPQGNLGRFCKYIRPALRNGSLFYTECKRGTFDQEAVLSQLRHSVAFLEQSSFAADQKAVVIAFPGLASSTEMRSLYAARETCMDYLYEIGMTGALCFRSDDLPSSRSRVDLIPETPFWVVRHLIPADEHLVGYDARAQAAYRLRFGPAHAE